MRKFKNKKTGATFEIVVPEIIKAIENDSDFEEITTSPNENSKQTKSKNNKKTSVEKKEHYKWRKQY